MDVAAQRVELTIADGVEMPGAVLAMTRLEFGQRLDDTLHVVAHHSIAADHVRVDIGQLDLSTVE